MTSPTTLASISRLANNLAVRSLPRRLTPALRPLLPLLAILGFAVWFLSPIIRSPFSGDDYFLSFLGGYTQAHNLSLLEITWREINGFMLGGRLFPAHLAAAYFTHYAFPDRMTYKVFVIGMVLVNLILFYAAQRRWKVDRAVAQFGVLLVILLMQMRVFHDALLAYTGQFQLIVSQLLIGVLCLQQHLRTGRRRWLGASVFVYGFSLLTYEINYAFFLVYLVVAFAHLRRWKPAIATVIPHAAVAALLVAFVLGLRFHCDNAPPDYRMNLDSAKIVETAGRQVFAALPISYATMSVHTPTYFSFYRLLTRLDNWSMFLVSGLLSGALLIAIPRETLVGKRPPAGFLVGAILIWILPAIPIALSTRYQREILTGLAYLPVYVEYFGVAMLGVWGVLRLLQLYPANFRLATVAITTACASAAMVTFDMNRRVVDQFRSDWSIEERDNVEAALKRGLLDPVPAEATLLVTSEHDWIQVGWPGAPTAFFSQHAKRKINVVNGRPGREQPPLIEQLRGSPTPTFAFCAHAENGRSGYALLSQICDGPSGEAQTRFGARSFRIFVRGDRRLTDVAIRQMVTGVSLLDEDAQSVEWSQLTLENQGRGWVIYKGSFAHASDVATLGLKRESVAAETAAIPGSRR